MLDRFERLFGGIGLAFSIFLDKIAIKYMEGLKYFTFYLDSNSVIP
jgi:hypothetical protein